MNFFKTVLFIMFCAVYCMAGYSFESPIIRRMPPPDSKLTQGDVRVLVVLVEFSDVRFKSPDPVSQFTDYLNKEGYNEYHNIGSVRDYFIKNSMGEFRPIFDVYGPVTLPENKDYYNVDSARQVVSIALDSLDNKNEVDFFSYDNDNDGAVDFLIVFYAGIDGREFMLTNTLSSHASWLGNRLDALSGKKMKDGLFVNRHAFVNEISGSAYTHDKSTSILTEVGLTIHEFSHVLGLPDLYVGIGSLYPENWSVMQSGGYNCSPDYDQKCIPPLYSAFERMSLGWLTPTEIKSSGLIRLNKLDDNVAYSITNPENPDEMYLLEYRSNKGWDIGQDTSGMLIWHVNYVESVWEKFKVNDENPMNVDLVEAKSLGSRPGPWDAFPGRTNVTEFNKFVFWNGLDMNITLSDITESPDKEYVTFNVTMGEPFMRELSSSSSFDPYGSKNPSSSSSRSTPYSWPGFSVMFPISTSSIKTTRKTLQQAYVISQNGIINITTPLHGTKKVHMFSLNGQLLFEKQMDGTELQFAWPKHLGEQKAVLSVTQGNANLFMGVIDRK